MLHTAYPQLTLKPKSPGEPPGPLPERCLLPREAADVYMFFFVNTFWIFIVPKEFINLLYHVLEVTTVDTLYSL